MSGYQLLPAAVRDVESIWDYTERNWGVKQAEAYLRQIQHAIESVAEHPDFGKRRADIAPVYYSIAVGSHVVFFRIEDGIVVVRVLHQRMDPRAHKLL
ncbi:type II toxin-antitoxin system RelE/ParE family toxin [Mobiluncus mulieris]|uniref:Toxin n=1 Tax=Mobiluncus mulieris TaxID=2052 RepID=A0ABD4TY48_9ACTO|nr:type II toxin-antitoxin system RelE/ParE family toxin [Mobiluncus mulieris]MCU9969334.1 type II toxin-antitoxin system RelE/ParE family toxin [Mobiluncus mulieris]MCU9973399.1 type II toxin-antitoxin system RelE/ParE family toxin [Mobiluncus mulieris]MCV0008919.1 type II toxin-antitoxin system RelE/ParE family toxin [Mobiluncus mulieris]NMW74647.1 type II toxin-antitoxin system RelE/ParE family toxin [Mobiluncus mulieris]NMX00540.1 type II toxin-antitoxin system RelE/ParE family toxin [Mobi